MATLALPALVSLTGPGGVALSASAFATATAERAVLAAIGSYIDNAFIFPALFPPETSFGPRIDDQSLTSAKEGEPKNICIGPECRTDGQLIWCSRLTEYRDDSAGGGKGGQSGNFVTYKYYCHAAVAICENQINKVTKIWADGKVLYNVAPDLSITVGTHVSGTTWNTLLSGSEGAPDTYMHFLKLSSAAGIGPDLSKFVSGKYVTITNLVATNNNGVYKCFESGVDSAGTSYCTVWFQNATASNYFTAFVAGSANATGLLFQDAPAFSQKQVQDVIFYYGTETQQPDILIESYEGTGNVPGFRGIAYVVFQNLSLQDFGNRLPNFTFLVEADTSITVGDTVARILQDAGVDSGVYDVSAIQDQDFRGITLTGPQAPISDLQPIMIAYNIAAQLRDGVLTFLYRQNLPVFAVDVNDLASRLGTGESSGRPFSITDKIDYELSSQITVEYMDPAKDYQTGTQTFTPANPMKPNPNTTTFPITMDGDSARVLAENLFWLQWASRQQVDFTLPPSYLTLREGDIVTFTYNNADYRVLIQQIDRGQESQFIVISGTIEDSSIFTRSVVTENNQSLANGFDYGRNYGYPAPLIWTILDIPALREEHLVKPGFYVAACYLNQQIPFGGAALYESNGSTYNKVDDLFFESHIGYTTSAVSSAVDARYWDDASTLTVVMYNGTLSSCTETQCLNGANRACIGNEIIGYMNAVLVDINTYQLTHLLRGLRGTEAQMVHATEEMFVRLDGPGVIWHNLTLAALGQNRNYKLVSSGSVPELEQEIPAQPQGVTLRAFAPAEMTVTKDGSNNTTITFVPRSRALGVDFMPQNMPYLEERDVHQVDLYTNLGAFLRTKTTADGVYSVTYLATEQTADGISPGANIGVKITRKSARTYSNPSLLKTLAPIPL